MNFAITELNWTQFLSENFDLLAGKITTTKTANEFTGGEGRSQLRRPWQISTNTHRMQKILFGKQQVMRYSVMSELIFLSLRKAGKAVIKGMPL